MYTIRLGGKDTGIVILERDCISRIENGLRMVQDFELRAIAGALGVTTDWLLEVDEK